MLLKEGSNNLRVVKLQLQLRALDYYEGPIDGFYSELVENTVCLFQKEKGLQVDGLAGKMTLGSLDKLTMNHLLLLFLHCAATPEGRPDKARKIVYFHTKIKGWSRPGYSDIIELDGKLVNVKNWDQDDMVGQWEYTFGVHGSTLMNRNARHVCYIGGVKKDNINIPKDTRTKAQLKTMELYIKFNLLRNPKLVIAGHNQVQIKGCPSFNVPDYLKSIGVDDYNIAQWGELFE